MSKVYDRHAALSLKVQKDNSRQYLQIYKMTP